jgi:hypothetical protein
MPAPVASGWSESPGGACTHWKAPPCHGAHPLRSFGAMGAYPTSQRRRPVGLRPGVVVLMNETRRRPANHGCSCLRHGTRCRFCLLRRQRRDWPANADVWSFRRNWLKFEKPGVQSALLSGRYRFEPLQRVTKADGSEADLWSARDALVLARVLPVSPRCTHIKGNGGAKAAVRQVSARSPRTASSCGPT